MPALLRILITAAAILPSASAIADDAFMAIHLDNQKIGSPVASYWLSQSKAASPDGFIAIHMDNQKIGSAVAAYWQAYSAEQPARLALGIGVLSKHATIRRHFGVCLRVPKLSRFWRRHLTHDWNYTSTVPVSGPLGRGLLCRSLGWR